MYCDKQGEAHPKISCRSLITRQPKGKVQTKIHTRIAPSFQLSKQHFTNYCQPQRGTGLFFRRCYLSIYIYPSVSDCRQSTLSFLLCTNRATLWIPFSRVVWTFVPLSPQISLTSSFLPHMCPCETSVNTSQLLDFIVRTRFFWPFELTSGWSSSPPLPAPADNQKTD